MMEVKMNPEIRDIEEKVLLGFGMRQSVCIVLSCLAALIVWFSLQRHLPKEVVSWLCIFSAIPFATAGFVKLWGMQVEQFLIVWISYLTLPKQMKYIREE